MRLDSMHRCTYRTVRLFDGKVRSRNGTSAPTVVFSASANGLIWLTFTPSVSSVPLATLAILLPPLFSPAVVSDTWFGELSATDLQTLGSQDAVACDNTFSNYAGSFY